MPISRSQFRGRRRIFKLPGAALPAYIPTTAGAWAQFGNALSTINPSPTPAGASGPQAKIAAWTAFVIDALTSDLHLIAAGGHNDYAGNEANKLPLNTESPTWVETVAPSAAGIIVDAASYYSDGHGAARHHFYGAMWNAALRKVMLLGGAHWSSSGGFHNAISGFNVDSNTWDPDTTHGNLTSNYLAVPAVCADTLTGNIYTFGNYAVGRWLASDFSFTEIMAPGGGVRPYGYNAPSAFDSTRNQIFLIGGQTADTRHLYSVSGNSFTQPTLTGPNAAEVQAAGQGSAMEYIPPLDAYFLLVPGPGAVVYKIGASDFYCELLAATGNGSIPEVANNDGSNPKGPYGLFKYVPNLQSCVYIPRQNQAGWVMRAYVA